jgi:hypothetical protein
MENIGIYMLAALVFPDFAEDRHADLHGTYFRQARWFYGLLVLALIFSMLKDLVVFGGFPTGWNLAFHLVVIAGSLAAAFIRSETFHKSYAVFSAFLFLTYIGTLFDYLH